MSKLGDTRGDESPVDVVWSSLASDISRPTVYLTLRDVLA